MTQQCNEYSYSTEKSGNGVVGDPVDEKRDDCTLPSTDSSFVSAEKFSIDDSNFDANDSPRSLHLDINSIATANAASDMLSPSFSLHSSPSLGALNETKNQTLYLTPYSVRDSPEADFSSRKLIRSNSYTLDTPSPLLLQLMEANGISANNSSPPKPTASSQPSLHSKDKLPPAKQAWAGATTKIAVKKTPPMQDVKTTKSTTARKSISPASSVRVQPKKDLSKPKPAFYHRKIVSARNQESVLRSIYDSGLSSRSMAKPKKLNAASMAASSKSTARIEKPTQTPVVPPEPNAVEFQRILKMIEEQHSTQMNALIGRQKEEQIRMHEEFARQQEMLVKQISHLILPAPNVSVSSNLNKTASQNNSVGSAKINNNSAAAGYDSTDNDDMLAIVSRDHNGNQLHSNRIGRKQPTPESLKCMRRLVYYDDNEMVSSDLCESNKQPSSEAQRQQSPIEIPPSSSDDEELFRIQNDAAMIITAYAKGYLTRRLFKTVKVQNIVKTIKDTLLFILDIHFENPIGNDSPADLKLKTHLIQQVRNQFQIKSIEYWAPSPNCSLFRFVCSFSSRFSANFCLLQFT